MPKPSASIFTFSSIYLSLNTNILLPSDSGIAVFDWSSKKAERSAGKLPTEIHENPSEIVLFPLPFFP